MTKEILLFCDESDVRGQYYSNFYGGALVRSIHIKEIQNTIEEKKGDLNFHGEVKWQKVTSNYLDKYIELMDLFFNFIKDDKIKVRIMFSQTAHVPKGLEPYHLGP